jgi:hypothetical protein
LFSRRLQTRARIWWGKPNKWRNRESYSHLLHRIAENHLLRSKDDPDDRWHCCDLWQRTLSNKWNAREFVQRYGCRVPALYWYGWRVGRLPAARLPEHFVIRPVFGEMCRGVYVFAGAQELLRQRSYTTAEWRAQLRRDRGRISRFPTLVEEFVKSEAGEYRLPVNFKFHTFGETIGMIQVVQRTNIDEAVHAFYSPSWERVDDQFNVRCTPGPDVDPPRCLDELLACARRLGVAYGTYVRVDLYATERGCVFGEFSTTPDAGKGFTPFIEQYFEELWRATFPDRT